MPLSISTNIASLTAQRSFINSNAALETAYERLSTGKRINGAGDDAAGLAIATDLAARASGLNQAVRNVNDGISMVQIMDGAYDEVTSILQRMRDMAVQAASGSLTTTEKEYLESEKDQLVAAIDSALDQAKFASKDLVGDDGTGVSINIQSGANTGDTVSLTLSSSNAGDASNMGVSTVHLDSDGGTTTIGAIDTALGYVATQRATLGAHQAQLESTVRNLSNVAENTAAAAGRVMDTDYAAETANLTKAQILQQAATSVLAQANAQPQAVLSLLQ
jgi:flagellin